ncbi:unnamed protein product [Prorocentrum cordatum]|uniref:Uncharacterized protein n=1 Tax=Prorocentrum cordatum TaxID=2364126 RepID=A0ABN9YA35_9DINO|nr:unnamed protein product [Polarella glacialis]
MIIIIIIFIISLRRLMPQPAATARLSRTRWSKRISYGHRAPASPPHIPLSSARAQCRSSRFSHALVEALQRIDDVGLQLRLPHPAEQRRSPRPQLATERCHCSPQSHVVTPAPSMA